MLLPKLYNRITKKPLKLYWWRYEYPSKLNFGDEITPVLIERLFGKSCKWTAPDQCDVAGAGSIIEILQQLSSGKDIQIWGSGFIKKTPLESVNSNFTFKAVRGRLTKERINKKVALGDPGLLSSAAFPIYKRKKAKYRLGVVPHYIDKDHPVLESFKESPEVLIIDVLNHPKEVIEQITSCSVILSSSLHGLIVSDSYNIPNYWMPLGELTGEDYKFKDYYSVFKMKPQKVAFNAYKEYKKEEGRLIDEYKPKKSIEVIQQNLIKSFPG